MILIPSFPALCSEEKARRACSPVYLNIVNCKHAAGFDNLFCVESRRVHPDPGVLNAWKASFRDIWEFEASTLQSQNPEARAVRSLAKRRSSPPSARGAAESSTCRPDLGGPAVLRGPRRVCRPGAKHSNMSSMTRKQQPHFACLFRTGVASSSSAAVPA